MAADRTGQVEWSVQTGTDLDERAEPELRRRHLDGQRKPVELLADAGDDVKRLGTERPIGPDGTGAIGEQGDSGALRVGLDHERLDRDDPLTGHPEGLTARH